MQAVTRATRTRRRGLGWVASAATMSMLALIGPVAPTAAPGAPVGYIVQATSAQLAAGAVTEVGGELTHRLEVIDAVGARLSAEQLTALRTRSGVRIYDNRTAETATSTRNVELTQLVKTKGPPRKQHQGLDTEYPSFIEADKLHQAAIDGAGVTIAFLDTGVWTNGTQIEQGVAQNGYGEDRILAQYNAVVDVETSGPIFAQLLNNPGVATDLSGHGTHVSSVAASSYLAEMKGKVQLYNGVAPTPTWWWSRPSMRRGSAPIWTSFGASTGWWPTRAATASGCSIYRSAPSRSPTIGTTL